MTSLSTDRNLLAARVGPHVELVGVNTQAISGEVMNPSFEPPLAFELNVEPSFSQAGRFIVFRFRYSAVGSQRIEKSDGETSTDAVANLGLTLVLVYRLLDGAPDLDADCLEAFGGFTASSRRTPMSEKRSKLSPSVSACPHLSWTYCECPSMG